MSALTAKIGRLLSAKSKGSGIEAADAGFRLRQGGGSTSRGRDLGLAGRRRPAAGYLGSTIE